MREAFDAWWATDPDTNPDSPSGPQAMPQYREPGAEQAGDLRREGDALFERGSDEGKHADEYVRTTVYLATVLFLVGISTQFPVRVARYGLLTIGFAILAFAVVQLITFPKPL
jgi:hypothetical protein